MVTQEEVQPIMMQLKASTQLQHDATEEGIFNQDLVKGKLPLDAYVDSLEQLFLIHRALEGHLQSFRSRMPAFARVLKDYQFQEQYLKNDLAYFKRDIEKIRPLPATKEFIEYIDQLAARAPMGLLGVHYVFEGSNNGSKFISRAVRRAYGLTDLKGTHYLDPYGESQKDYWQAFKDGMNSVGFLPPETDAIVKAAGATFEAVMHLHRELGDGCKTAASVESAATAKPAAGKCPFHHG